jgi:hypothetical protein
MLGSYEVGFKVYKSVVISRGKILFSGLLKP